MASSLAMLCFTLLFLLSVSNAVEEFKVGDKLGWREPSPNHTKMYANWALRRRFHVGDSLHFVYKNDSVLVVDKWDYYHCNSTAPVAVFTDGNTTVTLDKAGTSYFVSGYTEHCKNGQRLMVEVMPLHPISESPPTPATPPRPFLAPAPSPAQSSGSLGYGPQRLLSVCVVLVVSFSALG